jgi:hypothetical protein
MTPDPLMSATLATIPTVVDTTTGEVFAIGNAPTGLIAATVDRVKTLQSDAREARAILEHELEGRLATAGERSLTDGAFAVERADKRDWDPALTWEALSGLVAAGLVSTKEADEAMPERAKRVCDGRKLNALLGRLVGEDPVAASPLAKARAVRTGVRVARVAVDAEVAA